MCIRDSYADWIFCLVRTSTEAKKQDGISFLCIDMRSPGVVVRPIISIDGSHYLNEVTFTDVETDVANLVGEPGKGWTYARYLLTHERTSYAHVAGKRRQVAQLKDLARAAEWSDEASNDRRAFLSRLAEVCLLYTSPSPRDRTRSRMPSSA